MLVVAVVVAGGHVVGSAFAVGADDVVAEGNIGIVDTVGIVAVADHTTVVDIAVVVVKLVAVHQVGVTACQAETSATCAATQPYFAATSNYHYQYCCWVCALHVSVHAVLAVVVICLWQLECCAGLSEFQTSGLVVR